MRGIEELNCRGGLPAWFNTGNEGPVIIVFIRHVCTSGRFRLGAAHVLGSPPNIKARSFHHRREADQFISDELEAGRRLDLRAINRPVSPQEFHQLLIESSDR